MKQSLTTSMSWRRCKSATLAFALGLLAGPWQAAPASAQAPPADQAAGVTLGVPWIGERGITESVEEIVARDALTPAHAREAEPFKFHDRSRLPQDRGSLAVPNWPFNGSGPMVSSGNFPSLVMQNINNSGESMLLPQPLSTDFIAATLAQSNFIPPYTMGDVGPTQIMSPLLGRTRVFTRAGVLDGVDVTSDVFFASVRNGSTVDSPRVVYDRLSQRWFLVAINRASPANRILIAVSSGPTIADTSSFTFYQFQQDVTGGGTADNGAFADYPSLGVDANALYIGCNMFKPSFTGSTGWVVRKTSVLSGGPIVVTTFRQMATSGGEGPFSPRGVTNDDPGATEGYFVGVSNLAFGRLVFRRVSNPAGVPSISSNILLTVPMTSFPISVPALGSTRAIDASDDRLFDARIRRDRATGARTLWTAHCIQVNTSGASSTSGGRDGARWYQIGNLTSTPALVQSGTLFDNASVNQKSYIYPTVAMSGQGHMAIGTSFGGAQNFMSSAAAGRLASDPLGTTRAPTTIIPGAAAYSLATSGLNPWGYYSSTVIDPVDDQSIWAFTEYTSEQDIWAVRVTKLLAPPPATPASISPNSIGQGATNINLSVTGASVSGSAFYDTEPGYSRLLGSFSGAGVTVNSITFNSVTSLTLNVSVSGGAAAGPRNLTITNPDGQSAAGTNLLTISARCTGDLNNDGLVDDQDFVAFLNAYNILDCMDLAMPPGCPADFNASGLVDDADFVIFVPAYNNLLCP